jgi:2-amino-4-hydroxy-6-hydroxymethyldihydropteridine diphosphokinase
VVKKYHLTFIALGSNLGDRMTNLEGARGALQPALHILAQSPVYETAPWGYTDQPNFLNQVIKAETDLTPEQLLATLKSAEVTLGRTPTFRYGPRTIDLDLLLYDDLVMDTPQLTIPHPRLTERAFVLYPLADLTPDLRHPVAGLTIRQLRDRIHDQSIHIYGEL